MKRLSVRIMMLLALIPAGFIVQVVAREYGLVPSAAKEQKILQELVVPDSAGGRLTLETMENLSPVPGQDAPRVTFSVRSFDPETEAVFPADESELREIVMWQLQILDGNGRKIQFMQGRGRPESPTMGWYGLADDGKPFPGGFYSARFVWRDLGGKLHATAKSNFNLFAPMKVLKLSELKLNLSFMNNI